MRYGALEVVGSGLRLRVLGLGPKVLRVYLILA